MATEAPELLQGRDLAGLTHEQLLRFYRKMVTSRRIDDRERRAALDELANHGRQHERQRVRSVGIGHERELTDRF